MDGLRPERDELDRFQSRSGSTKTSKTKPVKKGGASDSGPGGIGKSSGRSSSGLVAVCLVLILALFALLGWGYIKQNETLTALNRDLDEALDFINQSKLSMARLQGELSETGAEIQETGTSAAKQLEFLDSEMRKLWGVAGDRNKKAISQNQAEIAGFKAQFSRFKSSQFESLVKRLKDQQAIIAKLQAEINAANAAASKVTSLEQQVATTASELSLTRESLEERFDRVSSQVGSIPDTGKATIENTKAIASIDASRRQINERLVNLEQLVNKLKLDVSTSKAPSTSQN